MKKRVDIIAHIKSKVSGQETDLNIRMLRYRRNYLYLSGEQWLLYNTSSHKIVLNSGSNEDWTPRPVNNKMIEAYQINVANLTRRMPTHYIVPKTNEQKDRYASEVSGAIIDWNKEINDEIEKYKEAISYKIICAKVFKKRYWTEDTGQYMEIPVTKTKDVEIALPGYKCGMCEFEFTEEEYVNNICPQCSTTNPPVETILKRNQKEEYFEIENRAIEEAAVDIVPPWEIICPSNMHKKEDMPWIVHRKWVHIDKVKSMWGKKADKVNPCSEYVGIDLRSSAINTIMNMGALDKNEKFYGAAATNKESDMVAYDEFYEQPTQDYKKGYFTVSAGGVVLHEQDKLPYKGYNFFESDFIKIPGYFWSKSMVDVGIRTQDKINNIGASIALNRKLNIFARLMYPEGSIKTNLSTNPTENIEYEVIDGMKPEVISGKGLPADIYKELDDAIREFDLKTFNTSISRGINPKGVYSGVGINLLKEESTTGLRPIIESQELVWQKEMKFILELYKDKVKNEKIIRIVGRNNERKVYAFKGADIEGNTDIRIRVGSSFPRSQAVQQEKIFGLMDRGFFANMMNNPKIQQELLKELEITGDYNEQYDLQREQQLEEIYKFTQDKDFEFNAGMCLDMEVDPQTRQIAVDPETGQPVPKYKTLTSFDDDRIHYEVIVDEIIKPTFRDYEDDVRQILLFHANEHRQRLFEAMAQQSVQGQGKSAAGE